MASQSVSARHTNLKTIQIALVLDGQRARLTHANLTRPQPGRVCDYVSTMNLDGQSKFVGAGTSPVRGSNCVSCSDCQLLCPRAPCYYI